MKIGYLGAGAWGFCLASLLASKGNEVVCWTKNEDLAQKLNQGLEHPHLKGCHKIEGMLFTTDLNLALDQRDIIVESVTTSGFRPVFELVKKITTPNCPIVITSKGIEQNTGLILPETCLEIFGNNIQNKISILSGPGYAEDVINGLPTSVVGAAYDLQTMHDICEIFTTKTFRVYPNTDIKGVAYGGSLKNIIAIACGISEGLGLGYSSKAALMTRGLHEIKKLALANGCKADTINGLSGMGDVCLTCGSLTSRNSRFGYLLAKGLSREEAENEIKMVVEGIYTCISALQLAKDLHVTLPITEIVYKIIYENLSPREAVKGLMERTIKEEHL